jgi:NMD protein affecting ribosome stability and mRNA decay
MTTTIECSRCGAPTTIRYSLGDYRLRLHMCQKCYAELKEWERNLFRYE